MILHRVRHIVAAGLLLISLGVTLGLLSSSGGAAVTDGAFGISSISGMTKVIDDAPPLCSGIKGTALPDYCSWDGATGSLEQGWVQDAAINAYGSLNKGLPLPIPLDFAREHSGPAEVFLRVVSFATQDEAEKLLSDPQYVGTWDPNYTSLPSDAVNGGSAGEINSPANDGLTEYRFNWVGDTSEVDVNVLGANMTVDEAQAVAKLAAP